jgi:periplasmic protein TonB
MAKLDIYKQEWLEMLFEGRNKNYGAYDLRAQGPKILVRSFLIGASVFTLAIASNLIDFKGSNSDQKDEDVTLVEMATIDLPEIPEQPEVIEELPPPPPLEEAAKSVNDQVKFTEPEIVKAEKVKEEVATVEDLKTADPGQKTQEGDKEKGEIKVDERTGTADKGTTSGGGGNGDEGNKIYVAVEKKADPPGGMQSFYKSFANKFNAPEVDEGVRKIQVFLSFVVEKDGSFTDIKVIRDPGYGAGKEAVRVLKTMPKWTPAEQNGRKVRSQFTLPITIQVQ